MYRSLDQSSDKSDDDFRQSLIEDISIPYSGRLPQKLSVGSFVEIFGKTDENCDQFAVNLMTDSSDITLHFNVRFNEDSVVMNSFIDKVWSNEERETLKMSFQKNKGFTLIISVAEEVYRLFVNGIHFVDFKHRVPYIGVTSISIEGELQVLWIKCDRMHSDHNWDAFSTSISSLPVTAQTNEIQTFFEPKVPFIEDIPSGLRVGMVLSIIGRPLSNDQKIDINLVQKNESVRTQNIALHLSIRFDKRDNNSLVVRNHRIDGEWGPEDRSGNEFPFTPEKIFDLRIIVESNRFILITNGRNFSEYPNRLYPLSDTNQIEINGNLKLLSIRF